MTTDDELLHRCADGLATTEEMAYLAERLHADETLRTRYLDLMNLDTALQAHADGAMVEDLPRQVRSGWLRPYAAVAAAAAGLVVGGLAVGTAWAIVQPRNQKAAPVTNVALTDAGFELGQAPGLQGVPNQFGVWQGDPAEAVESHGAVQPHEGERLLRFKAASTGDAKSDGEYMACDLWQVVELPESLSNGPGIVRVQAWFNSTAQAPARFHLMAIATDSPPTRIPELWEQRYVENNLVPSAARSMTFVDGDPATWERGEVALHVPAGARTLVVAIAAYRLSTQPQTESFPGQYVDAVNVSFIASPQ